MGRSRGRPGSATMPETPRSRVIVDDIRAQIQSGVLKPGAKLPSTEELKAKYECSDTPVKTALTTLEALGLIVRRQGVGSFVAGLNPQ